MKMTYERIDDYDCGRGNLLLRAKLWIIETRKAFVKETLNNQFFARHPTHQCFIRVIALFLMTEKVSRFNDDSSSVILQAAALCVGNKYKGGDQFMTGDAFQIEQNLWTLYVARELGGGLSQNDWAELLSRCFGAITSEPNKSRVLCLMLWLFPELATGDRIKTVEDVVNENLGLLFPPTWCAQDLMLFWLICVRYGKQEKVRDIEAQLRRLQSDSGAFSTEEGKDGGNVIFSAIGLLSIISCAGRNYLEGSNIEAAQKAACWILERLAANQDVDVLSRAWSVYALCEYIAFFRVQYN